MRHGNTAVLTIDCVLPVRNGDRGVDDLKRLLEQQSVSDVVGHDTCTPAAGDTARGKMGRPSVSPLKVRGGNVSLLHAHSCKILYQFHIPRVFHVYSRTEHLF